MEELDRGAEGQGQGGPGRMEVPPTLPRSSLGHVSASKQPPHP